MAVIAEVVVLDATTPLTPVAFGVALLNSVGVKYYGHETMTQSKQCIATVITGPVTDVVALATTALPGGSAVKDHQLVLIRI